MADFYKVDKVLEKKKFNNQLLFLVKWRGYDYNECTWEPKENLKTAPESLKEFEQNPPLKVLKSKIEKCKNEVKMKAAINSYKQLKKVVENFVLDKERELDSISLQRDKVSREREKSVRSLSRSKSIRLMTQEKSKTGKRQRAVEDERKVSKKEQFSKKQQVSKKEKASKEEKERPMKVVNEIIKKGFEVVWKRGTDGSKIPNSVLDYEQAMKQFPEVVAKYYSRLTDDLLCKKRSLHEESTN